MVRKETFVVRLETITLKGDYHEKRIHQQINPEQNHSC
jgi:hypothetical protein